MAQVFDRSSNALARASLVLTGLIVIALGVALNSLAAVALGDAAGPAAGPARTVQPQAPRRGFGTAVPVLSYVGGEELVRGDTADEDVYQLPLADLDERAAAGAGAA